MPVPLPTTPRSPLSRTTIDTVVHRFYERVQRDDLLAPVFASRISDWGPHLDRMVSFWCSVLLGEPGFSPGRRGSPVVLHRAMPELRPEHFQRWLSMFEQVVRAELSDEAADRMLSRAQRMGVVLSAHLPAATA